MRGRQLYQPSGQCVLEGWVVKSLGDDQRNSLSDDLMDLGNYKLGNYICKLVMRSEIDLNVQVFLDR